MVVARGGGGGSRGEVEAESRKIALFTNALGSDHQSRITSTMGSSAASHVAVFNMPSSAAPARQFELSLKFNF